MFLIKKINKNCSNKSSYELLYNCCTQVKINKYIPTASRERAYGWMCARREVREERVVCAYRKRNPTAKERQ